MHSSSSRLPVNLPDRHEFRTVVYNATPPTSPVPTSQFVVLAFDAPPETSILALDATGAWHDVSNAVSGVFPPSDPPLAAWALHGASASASDTTTLGVATPLGVVSVSLSPAASPDGGASTVSRTRAAKVGTWAPPAGRRLSIAAGDRDGMVACVQSVAYLLEAEGGQGDRIRLVGTWSLPGEASCAACVAVSSPETDPSKTDTWVAVGTWGGAGERAAVFLGRLRSANPAVCLDAGSVGPLRSICMVGARAGSGEDCRGWCVAGTADGRVAGRRFEFGEGEGRRTEESTTQSWAVMQVGHAPCEVSALPWSPGGSRAANGADRVICAAGGQCLAVEATERRLTTHRVVGWQRATCIRTACAAPAGVEEERPEEGKEGGVGIRWGEGAVVFGCDDSGVISLGTLVAQSQTRFRAVLQVSRHGNSLQGRASGEQAR